MTDTQRIWGIAAAHQRPAIEQIAEGLQCGPVRYLPAPVGRKSQRIRSMRGFISRMAAGDVLIVPTLADLGKSLLEVLEIIGMAMARGVRIRTVTGDWAIDGTVPAKVLSQVLALATDIERELIVRRTRAAYQTRCARGKKVGRPKGSMYDRHADEIRALLASGASIREVAREIGGSPSGIRIWLQKNT